VGGGVEVGVGGGGSIKHNYASLFQISIANDNVVQRIMTCMPYLLFASYVLVWL